MLPTWVTELETPGSASRDAPAATPPSAPVNAPRGPRWADQRRQFGRPVPNSEPPQCRGSALSGQRLTSSPSGRAFGGRGIGPRPPNPPPGVQYYGVVPFEWRTSRVAVLVLKGIESFTTTLDIFLTLHTHGNIVRIEIDDPNSQRGVSRTARVRFEPAPHSISFFEQGYCMMQGENRYWVGVDFPPQSDNGRSIRTPTGNLCPERLVLGLPGLSFGLLIDPTSFLVKKKLQYSANSMLGESKLTVDYKRKNLLVNFAVKSHGDIPDHIQRNTNRSQRSDQNHRGSDRAQSHGPDQTQSKTTEFPRYQHYRVEMKFSNIQGLSLVKNEKYSGLVINLCSPPIVWRMRNSLTETFYPGRLVWGEREMWLRALEVSDSPIQHSTPVSLQESHQIIDFGRWTTIWLDLDTASNEILLEMRFYLKDWNIHLRDDRDRDTLKQTWDRTPELWALLDEVGKALPFDVRYQLEVCVSHGVLSEYNVKRDFIDKLVELSHVRIMEFNRARLALEYAAEDKRILYNPMELFDNEAAMRYLPTTASLPDHCALVRKATITPTRIYFSTPTVETTNRVIRQFKSVQDSFLRIQFTDEVQEGQIHGCEDDRDDQIFHRAFRVMAHGIKMGDIHWKFLAFGNSQIRENGAYFFNEPGLGDNGEAAITCHTLRHWMGRFSHIKVIAKYAARLGQCLSTTRALPTVSAPHIIKIEDVESGKFCFTDGVGKISASLAKLVGQDWGIPPPSAIQFRMGGCKGVLVVWPDVSGTDIHIRKSQEKFLAEYNGLEVIRCSQYACATLNRQTITILSSLGVPDQVFVDIMDEQLTNYNKAMTDPKKAAELLSLFVDENQMTRTIESMILNGFMETLEPFVHALLHLWRSWSIKELKERAKLVIEEGAFVLGGVDETGTLQGHLSTTEGSQGGPKEALLPQIFLQIPDPRHGGRYRIVTGLCIVGRNPALHPGDIRVVMAVDCPMLRHIKNVVIFPLKGDCDVPSMCSGGDLDGDDFFVIWDERLLPKQWSHPPMNYTPAPPMEEPEGVTANGLKHFFVLFIKHNTLPLIAHAHLATADYEKEGPNHEKCEYLFYLESQRSRLMEAYTFRPQTCGASFDCSGLRQDGNTGEVEQEPGAAQMAALHGEESEGNLPLHLGPGPALRYGQEGSF